MDGIEPAGRSAGAQALAERYKAVRAHTGVLTADLTEEDQCVQSMPDASPAKWHKGHTAWFFEQFILVPHVPGYVPFDPTYFYIFNSYYENAGPRHPRPARGMLTRPPAGEVEAYRRHVDAAMAAALPGLPPEAMQTVELGLHHEQQHQELMITDMLHAFSLQPLYPAMMPDWREPAGDAGAMAFVTRPGGVCAAGHAGVGFCFDNETPRHQVLLQPYAIGSRLVRNGEWLGFVRDGGYRTPLLWMSDGWAAAQLGGWEAPLHWRMLDGEWFQMGPGGLMPLVMDAPVRHVSWYEADAFARWQGVRLPTEFEWEAAASDPAVREMFGTAWQWTESPYRPYPGFRAAPGAVGEYNGKFMINQMVLRGGSVATPAGHSRSTYRNFFHPDKRWQFSGVRLAKDL